MPQVIQIKCDAILFDMDGTLVDSTACVEAIWARWALKHGVDKNYLFEVSHGRRTIDTLRDVAPHLNIEEESQALEMEELTAREGIVEVPGARQLLDSLKPRQWAVVTSASQALATLRLECAGLPIPEVLISADDIVNGKPSPEGYLKAASRLGVEPRRCLVVEDTPAGILAGRRAGMDILGLTTTFAPDKLLGATCVANFHEVTFSINVFPERRNDDL